MSVQEKMTALADAIRTATGREDKLTLDQMTAAIDQVVEAARQREYDHFWDNFQDYGTRGNYQNAFTGSGNTDGWNDAVFKPKYDIVLGYGYTGNGMFMYSPVTDLVATLENQGVVLDTSRCGYFSQMFQHSRTARIPEINCTSDYGYGLDYTFSDIQAHTIENLVVTEQLTYPNTFKQSTQLENIQFTGKIGQDISFADCHRLSAESIENIVTALSDTATGKTVTFSREAVENAYADMSIRWQALEQYRSNWNILLV